MSRLNIPDPQKAGESLLRRSASVLSSLTQAAQSEEGQDALKLKLRPGSSHSSLSATWSSLWIAARRARWRGWPKRRRGICDREWLHDRRMTIVFTATESRRAGSTDRFPGGAACTGPGTWPACVNLIEERAFTP